MSIRTNASGESVKRTVSLPAVQNFTACGWAQLVTDRNNYSCIFSIDDGAHYTILETDVDGTTLLNVNSTQVPAAILSLNVGSWYFWAIACSASTQTGYAGAPGSVLSSNSFASVSFTPTSMFFGNDVFDEWMDGRIAALKVWDATLSATEIQRERFTYVPQRKTNLHGWWPCYSHTDLNDRSGNGKILTAAGTLHSEQAPPIMWAAPRTRQKMYSVTAAAGGGNRRRRVLLTRAA